MTEKTRHDWAPYGAGTGVAGGTKEEAAPAATCADLRPKISSRAAWLTLSASSKMCDVCI